MPFFLPVRVDDTDAFPGYRLSGFSEYDEMFESPHDAFGPLANIQELPIGPAEDFLPDGVLDPRPLMAREPYLMFYVFDDGIGGGGYFAGFDQAAHPVEIPNRRYVVSSEEHGIGDPVWAATILDANTDDGGALVGLTPEEWLLITRLHVGDAVAVGGGAGVLFTVKRITDASRPLVDPEARFRYPESESPEGHYSHSELWHCGRTGDDRLGWDAGPWASVLALGPGERYAFPGNENIGGSIIERVR